MNSRRPVVFSPLFLRNYVPVAVSLLAFTFGATAQTPSQAPSNKNAVSSPQLQIKATAITTNSVTINVAIPGTPPKFLVELNGHDVSSHFSPASCDGATCKSAVLTQVDGLRSEKDVLTVNAGQGLTGRLRFDTNTGVPVVSNLPQLRPMAIMS